MLNSLNHVKRQLRSHFCTLSEQTAPLIVLFKIIRDSLGWWLNSQVLDRPGFKFWPHRFMTLFPANFVDFPANFMTLFHVLCASGLSFVKWEDNSNRKECTKHMKGEFPKRRYKSPLSIRKDLGLTHNKRKLKRRGDSIFSTYQIGWTQALTILLLSSLMGK